jgi:hypothetical protein
MKGIVTISATLDISNDCHMESRINREPEVEFTFGTWQGSVEVIFERYALERFVELATQALDARIPPDAKAPPTLLISRTSEVSVAAAGEHEERGER